MGLVARACPVAIACSIACGRVGFEPVGSSDTSTVEPGPAPIGWWKLDDSATMAADSSGQGNAGQLSPGVAWMAGRVGGAASLPGANDQNIDLGDASLFHLSGSMTLAAWVNPGGFHLVDPY